MKPTCKNHFAVRSITAKTAVEKASGRIFKRLSAQHFKKRRRRIFAKMKIAEINSCNFGSTGNIMLGIAEAARESGMQAVCCVPESRDNLKKQ